MKIKSVKAREILSSGATPSIEVTCILESGAIGVASVPYGASAGFYEAFVLLDGDERYNGKGMLKAVNNVNDIISKRIIGLNAFEQRKIDEVMIKADGTENKKRLGANAILGVSLAVARAASNEKKIPLYQYIRDVFALPIRRFVLPNPMMVVIEGGKHADNSTDLQEYLISPIGLNSVKEAVRAGIEVFLTLKKVLILKGLNTNVGNEGAYAPQGIKDNEEPLNLIIETIEKTEYKPKKDISISLDPASSEVFKDGEYFLKKENKKLNSEQMIDYFENWINNYPIITLEDPLHEDDWLNWSKITKRLGEKIAVIGDDLTVTNPKRLQKAIELKAINAILIKLNQIGTLTETVDCCMLARKHNFMTVISHRGGGETNDNTMTDLAVAVNSGFVKVGPSRGERVEKYNRLMQIEDELGNKAKIIGTDFRKIF